MSLQDTKEAQAQTETPVETKTAAPADKAAKPVDPVKPAADADPAKDAKPVAVAKTSTSTSIFDDDDEDGEEVPAKADGDTPKPADGDEKVDKGWKPPDDWREQIAAGDEKLLSELKRSPSWDAWLKQQRDRWAKYRKGETAAPEQFDDAWDDKKKGEWRKANGIPDKPTDYALPEVKGHEWSEQEKAALSPFLERMHASNAKPEVVQEALGYYAEALQMAAEQKQTLDRQHKTELEDELRDEWGPDYRANINLMKRSLSDAELFPGGMEKGGTGEAMMMARLPDGRRLINVPGIAMMLANISRERYGETAMIPSSERANLDTRENEIRQIMNTDINRYYREKNSKGQTLEAELREIMARKSGSGKKAA